MECCEEQKCDVFKLPSLGFARKTWLDVFFFWRKKSMGRVLGQQQQEQQQEQEQEEEEEEEEE